MQSKDSVPSGVVNEPPAKPLDHLYLNGYERWDNFIPIAEQAVEGMKKLFTISPEQAKRIRIRVYTALCEGFERDLTENLTVEERWCRFSGT